ncbi:MAG: GHKL domain-containing protein [Oscillospiraceae bacterium]|nr:GHKL domain-containing protein [Oscillospiraceae bacterium]
MPLLLYLTLTNYSDSLTGHLILAAYLLAVTDERAIWEKLKKLPLLCVSPLIATLMALVLYMELPEFNILPYFITSIAILAMCTLWVMWAWRWNFWMASSAVCMAGILQEATTVLAQIRSRVFPSDLVSDTAAMAIALAFSIFAAALLKRFRFGFWFRLLLEDRSGQRRTAALMLALEFTMEVFFFVQHGVQRRYLAAYCILLIVLVIVIIKLIIYLARRFDDSRAIQAQQDIIAQQQLYEQDLEDIRRDIRSFRHDYKNLLTGLSQQAGEGDLDALRDTLSELDADFDRHLGEKIQRSIQIGNLRIPQVRSLLLGKLTELRKRGVECRLEVLYPVESVDMNIWDLVRCLGILTDNAAEAALETERPWVEIVLLAQGGRLFLRVSNPYTNALDPGKMWDEGWSTKGAGRGLGLPGYQRILESYPNVSRCTSWADGVFVQELTVEGRP